MIVKYQYSHIGVSQRMHETTNMWKLRTELQENSERKTTLILLHINCCAFQMNKSGSSAGIDLFLKTTLIETGAVCHNLVYHQQLPIAHYQVYVCMLTVISLEFTNSVQWPSAKRGIPRTPFCTCHLLPNKLQHVLAWIKIIAMTLNVCLF